MTTTNKETTTMTTKMAALFSLANTQKIGAEYTRLTRNPDASVRDAFRRDREIPGTRAWAIVKCGSLTSANYDDATCDAITEALTR